MYRAVNVSCGAKPRGKPVNPPIPNIGIHATANSIGVLNLMDPPYNDNIKADRIITEGTEIIIVVVWKKALIP